MDKRIDIEDELSKVQTWGDSDEGLKQALIKNERERKAAYNKELADLREHLADMTKERERAALTGTKAEKVAAVTAEQEVQAAIKALKIKFNAETERAEAKVDRQKKAIQKAGENEYAQASLSKKKEIIDKKLAAEKAYNANLLTMRVALEDEIVGLGEATTQQEKERINKLKQQVQDISKDIDDSTDRLSQYESQEVNYYAAQRKSREAGASVTEKANFYIENKKERAQARRDAEMERDTAAASLREAYSKEEISEEDFNKGMDKVAKDFKERDEKDDAKYGVKGDDATKMDGLENLGGMFQDLGLDSMAGLLGDVVGGVQMIEALFNTNPAITILKLIVKAVQGLSKALAEGIQTYAQVQEDYMSKINTRLDKGLPSSTDTFKNLSNGFQSIFGNSKYVSQKSLIQTLESLTSQGIAYNLEQRTILQELSDRMVSTFSVIEESLLTLTKLQQADMSVAQLGAESILTEFLNNNFSDTSYLTSEYDTITTTIMGALSQMSASDSVAFNYNVQKWLASLYALGMSSSGVQTIAEGINALATGDVDYFNGNDSARTLFALASGGSYADLLVNGVNADNVDTLLQNIVSYLLQISQDTNKVTKNVKAGLFGGLSMSDIRAVQNLTTSQVNAIMASDITWSTAKDQVSSYLVGFAEANTTKSELVNNLIDNTLYSAGENFIENHEKAYIGYIIGDKIGGTLGDVVKLMNGISGLGGTLKAIVNSAAGAFQNLTTDLDEASSLTSVLNSSGYFWSWDDSQLIKSGDNITSLSTGVISGISPSYLTVYGNEIDSDLTNSLYKNSTTVQAGLINYEEGASAVRDVNDVYSALFEDQLAIRVILADVEANAQQNLTNEVYRVNSNALVNIVDNIQDIKSVWSKMSNVFSGNADSVSL